MKLPWRKIIFLALCAVLVCGAYTGFHILRAFQMYGVEDRIAFTYRPVVDASYDYAEKHSRPPPNLSALVPDFLQSIPTCSVVDEVSYGIDPDGENWELTLHSSAYGRHRVYSWRSKDEYTGEEKKRILGQYHGLWVIMKPRE